MEFKISDDGRNWHIFDENLEICTGKMPSSESSVPSLEVIEAKVEEQGTGTQAALLFLAQMRKRGHEQFVSTVQSRKCQKLFRRLEARGHIRNVPGQELRFSIGELPNGQYPHANA